MCKEGRARGAALSSSNMCVGGRAHNRHFFRSICHLLVCRALNELGLEEEKEEGAERGEGGVVIRGKNLLQSVVGGPKPPPNSCTIQLGSLFLRAMNDCQEKGGARGGATKRPDLRGGIVRTKLLLTVDRVVG